MRYDSPATMSGNPLSARLALLWAAALVGCSAPAVTPAVQPAAEHVAPANHERIAPASPERVAPTSSVLARVDVIGASASAGFGLPGIGLAEALDEAIVVVHEPVRGLAEPMFFLAPGPSAARQVRAARERPASLVVAVDFLFWFGYGLVLEEEDRLELLERGLALLDGFDCPIVVGTVPEMREAIGKMLLAAQVPEPATLARIDERIRAWADARDDVVVLPLPELVARLREGRPFVIGGRPWPTDPEVDLLLPDELHPTVDGLAALSSQVAELLVESGLVPAAALRIDASEAARGLRRRMADDAR